MKPAIQALLRRARPPKLSPDAQDRLNAGLNAAKEHLKNENFGNARRTLEELGREYPNNPDVEVLLRHSQERLRGGEANVEIERLLSEARAKKAFGRFEPAMQLVQRALDLDSSNHSARALHRSLLDEQQRDRDRRTIETALLRCKSLVKQEELQEALLVVEELAAVYPRDARVAQARREIHEKVRNDGEHHQKAESTTQLLGNLAIGLPARSSVQDLLDHARRLKLSEQQVAGQIGPPNHEATALHWTLPEAEQDPRADQRRRDFQTGVQEAERLLSDGRFEGATKLLGDLAVQFPAEISLRDLLNRARQLEQEHIEEAKNTERLRLREQELSAMEAAVAGGDLEQAIHMAEAALAKFPAEPRAVAALQSARNLRELSDLVIYARRRVNCGDVDEARQLVTDGRVRFPDSPELLEIETEIEKAGAFVQSLRSIRNALKERRFDEARMIAEPLLTASPGNPVVRELLAEIETRHTEYERQQTYDRGRAEAERLARSLKFEAAIEKIQQLLGDFPADPALNEELNRVSAARDLHTKREGYLRGRAEAQSLSDHGKLEEAIAIIGRLLEDFPGDPALNADLKAMQAAELLREERIRIDVLIHELEIFFRNGDAEAVRRGAKQLLSKQKEPRAAELLEWAEKSIAQTREIRRKSRSRGPLLLSGGIGVVAVVVAAVLGLPPPPSPITVQPEEIAFFYAKGGPFPKPRSFQIKAGRSDQRWTTASNEPWLRFSKAGGTGTSDVAASVNPSALSPGEYQSIATVRSASVQKILIVRLHIAEPLESTPPPPQEIKIEPSTLEFSYVRTGAPPPSQRFRIVTIPAGQGWTVTGGNTWVLPSRHSGAGTSEVEVSVDPSNVATGDHTGIVRLTSAAAVKSLKVLLHVTEPELVFDPPVNCRDDQYNGRYTGTITWLGPLNDGEVLTIGNKNVASPGRASGRELPGCPVSITSVPALDIQEPAAASNYRQIRFTNNSGHAIDSIKITWNVKR